MRNEEMLTEEFLESHGWELGSICFPTFTYRKEGLPTLGGAYSESINLAQGQIVVYAGMYGDSATRIETKQELIQFENDNSNLPIT